MVSEVRVQNVLQSKATYMKLTLLEGAVQWILHTCNCLTLEAIFIIPFGQR